MTEIFNFFINLFHTGRIINIKNWEGIYSNIDKNGIKYILNINQSKCIYEVTGSDIYFIVELRCKISNNELQLYYSKKKAGLFFPSDWIIKNVPLIILTYKDGVSYTKYPNIMFITSLTYYLKNYKYINLSVKFLYKKLSFYE